MIITYCRRKSQRIRISNFPSTKKNARDSVQLLAEIAGKVASIDVLQCFAMVAKKGLG